MDELEVRLAPLGGGIGGIPAGVDTPLQDARRRAAVMTLSFDLVLLAEPSVRWTLYPSTTPRDANPPPLRIEPKKAVILLA